MPAVCHRLRSSCWSTCVFAESAFVGFVYSLTGNRFDHLCDGYRGDDQWWDPVDLRKMSWVWNWSLAGALRWSDMGPFEIDRMPLHFQPVLGVACRVLFSLTSWCGSSRGESSTATRTFQRLSSRCADQVFVVALAAARLCLAGWRSPCRRASTRARRGPGRAAGETVLGRRTPHLARCCRIRTSSAPMSISCFARRRWIRSEGTLELGNRTGEAVGPDRAHPGPHWERPSWTLNGESSEPENAPGPLGVRTARAPAEGRACRSATSSRRPSSGATPRTARVQLRVHRSRPASC